MYSGFSNYEKYGFVNFADAKAASKVLQTWNQLNDKSFRVKKRHSWHQPDGKKIELMIENVKNGTINHENKSTVDKALIFNLNDDCFKHILSMLILRDQIKFAITCPDFLRIFLMFSQFKYKMLSGKDLFLLTIWQIRLLLQMVGPQIKNLFTAYPKYWQACLIKPFHLYCTNIKKLKMRSIMLTTRLLQVLEGKMNFLTELELNDVKLTHCFIKSISSCQTLKILKIKNDERYMGHYISNLHQLEGLSLKGCSGLRSTYFKEIFRNLNNLRFLDIRGCVRLKTADFKEILKNLLLLETLKFTANDSQDSSCIAQLPNLKQLEVDNSKNDLSTSRELLIELAKYQAEQLEELNLLIPKCINLEKVGELKKLKVLFINNSKFLDYECLKKISQLSELREVDFQNCYSVNNIGVLHLLKHCLKLERLGLDYCRLEINDLIRDAIKLLKEQRAKMQRSNIVHISFNYTELCVPELENASDVLKIEIDSSFYRMLPVYEDDYMDEDSDDEFLNNSSDEDDMEDTCSMRSSKDLYGGSQHIFCVFGVIPNYSDSHNFSDYYDK